MSLDVTEVNSVATRIADRVIDAIGDNITAVLPLTRPSSVPSGAGVWVGTKHLLVSQDGDLFDMTDVAGGVFLTREGLKGLGMPPMTRWTTDSPNVDGVAYRGRQVQPRPVAWPLYVWADGTGSYLDLERRLFRALRPDLVATWIVVTPTSARRLAVRLVDDGDHQETFDVPLRGWERFGLNLIAEQPYWQGVEPQTASWGNKVPLPFFGGNGFGPPFFLNDSNDLARASITNDGDVPAWPVWTITGPASSFTVTVGGATSVVAHAITAGDFVTLDTNPEHRGLFGSDGVFLPGAMTQARFGAIPPGVRVPLAIQIDNPAATVACELTERYYRAR